MALAPSVRPSCPSGLLLASLACLLPAAAHAQTFTSGFEPPTFTASPAGTTINGQDSWLTPAVAGSVDGLVYTYAGNTLGIPEYPAGSLHFLGERSQGGTAFARAQREGISFPTLAVITYDAAANFDGVAPTAQNLGSFSLQPDANPALPAIRGFILLSSWVDINNPTSWNAGYLPYSAANAQAAQPGLFPGPEWQNLALNNWYRFSTTVDLTANRITETSITNLTTGVTTTAAPVDWFLGGGQNSTLPNPSGVRFFAGGGAGNIVAWDNLTVGPPETKCPCDWNTDGFLNSQDFFDFITVFFAVDPSADFNDDGFINSQDFFDFLACLFTGC